MGGQSLSVIILSLLMERSREPELGRERWLCSAAESWCVRLRSTCAMWFLVMSLVTSRASTEASRNLGPTHRERLNTHDNINHTSI